MSRRVRVLVVEDRPADAELMMAELRRHGYEPSWIRVDAAASFVASLDDPPDVILSDYSMPGFSGLDALALLRDRDLDLPFILISGTIGEETAVEALHRGADDYLMKDSMARLGAAVDRALEKTRLRAAARSAEQALRDSQTELATIFESAPVPILIVDAERRVVKLNGAARLLTEVANDDGFGGVVGAVLSCANALADPGGCGCGPRCPSCPLRAALVDTLETGASHRALECTLPRLAEPTCPDLTLLVSTSAVATTLGRLAMVAIEDISDRIRAERRIIFLNRLLTTIREINQLVVREQDRGLLLAETCRIVVEHGEFGIAWIGRADPEAGVVEPSFTAGHDAASVGRAPVRLDGEPAQLGSAARAIRERRTVVVHDLQREPAVEPWRAPALAGGHRSMASLPIVVDDQVFGVLSVFADRPNVFDHEIVDLLEELTADVGFALTALDSADRRDRAEAELRASEDRFRSLFEQSPTGIYRTTPAGRILDSNPALVQLLGYRSHEELESIDVATAGYASPDDRQKFIDTLDREGTVTGHEAAWRTRDGRVVHVRENARVVRGPDGRALYYEGTVEDVTLQRRAEAERDRLFDHALDLFAIAGFDGYFKQLNPAWHETLGWTAAELRAAPFLSFVHPEDVEATQGAMASLADGDHVLTFENRYRCHDGSYRWIAWNAHPLVDEGLIFAVARDTTDRKAAEEALRASEQRYRRFFEEDLTADYIAELGGAIVDCNSSFVRIFGFSSVADARSASMVSLFPTPAAREAMLAELAASGRLDNRELELRRRDGTPVLVIANLSLEEDAAGELRHVKGYMFDITERRRLEEQLLHAQKMEAVGRLAGGIAHDFNNLLQAMMSEISLIEDDLADHPSAASATRQLTEQVRLGASLTRQLLLFSRRSARRPERLDLSTVLHDTSGFLRHLVREDIAVDIRTADDPLPVVADRAQVDQVLMNLVVNASDAMPDGGVLTLRCGASDDATVWLAVSDTGVGIPEAIRARIFEPFFTTKSEGKGTGLGLSVVHGIVVGHKGTISVASTPGQGTTFMVTLPRATGSALGAGPEPDRAQSLRAERATGERLLLVEDEASARFALTRLLSAHGYTVTAVGSMREALALPDDPAPRLVLTDLVLPDGRGTDLARGAQVRWPGVKIVLMSGYANDSDSFREIATGSIRFLQKPFDIVTLTRELQEALAEAQPQAPPPDDLGR